MFIKKEKYKDLVCKIEKQKQEIEKLECEILILKDKNEEIMNELDNELTDNRNQYNKLKKIDSIIKMPFGTYLDLSNMRKKIINVLSNT